MKWKFVCFCAAVCALGVAGCSKGASTPASPSGASATTTASANADGSTLKASAPGLVSPPNGEKLDQTVSAEGVALTVTNAVAKYNVGIPASYRFQLFNAGGALIEDSGNVPAGAQITSYTLKTSLEGDQTYRWQARAEVNGGEYFGSWSTRWSFIAPQTTGYLVGSELYDPLIDGTTIGSASGPMTFIPGVGLRFESFYSYVAYVLPQTLTEGEFSLIVTGMPANTDGDKTKVMSMSSGFGDVVTNDRRMTVEKRGDPAGVVAWRFITHGDQVDTEGPDRQFVNFLENQTYFFQSTWRGNRFNLLIKEGGTDGKTIYNLGKNFKGRAYDPNPHVIYLGMPVGRSGETGASVDKMTIRQVWVSGRPRPAFANK